MKVLLSKAEVEGIVLNYINTLMQASFNSCEVSTYSYRSDYCEVTTVVPDEPEVAPEVQS